MCLPLWLLPREGLEPTLPCRKRILSPPRLPFRHLGLVICKSKKAAGGFEPPYGGFADPCLNLLATPPRLQLYWSGRRDSNPRPPPWQGGILPLNYFRSAQILPPFSPSRKPLSPRETCCSSATPGRFEQNLADYAPESQAFPGALIMVPRGRFELPRAFAHHPLKMACLPIPPPRHNALERLRFSGDPKSNSSGRGGRTRTRDLRFWRPLLYPLSYRGTLLPQLQLWRNLLQISIESPLNLYVLCQPSALPAST